MRIAAIKEASLPSQFTPLNLPMDAKSRFNLVLTAFLGFAKGLLVVAQAWLLSWLIAGVFAQTIEQSQITQGLELLLGVFILRAGLNYSSEITAYGAASGIKSSLREKIFSKWLNLGPIYLQGEHAGELANTATSGIELLETYFSQFLPQLVLAVVVPLSLLIAIFPLDVLTGLILLVTAPLIPLFMVLIADQTQVVTRRQWLTLSYLSSYFLDTLQGLATLKNLGQNRERRQKIVEVSERFRRVTLQVLRVSFLSALILELIGAISVAIIAVEIGLRLLAGGIDYSYALFILILAPEFYLPLRTLGTRFHAAMPGMEAALRIKEILQEGEEKKVTNRADLAVPSTGQKEPEMHFDLSTNGIVFDHVDFTYGAATEDLRPALYDLNFSIHAGEHVAIVGPSGAGKSTIFALLLKFIEPTGGRIEIGGQSLQALSSVDWRKSIAWVPQQPYLFNASLESNILLGNPQASPADLEAAISKAHLDDLVGNLPQGLQTPIGEQGALLSGGFGQRVALARAFLKNAPVLLLDEPTSNLDPKQNAYLQETLAVLCEGKTILTIAHSIHTARSAHRILVMAKGHLVESGVHAELIEKNGVYAQMVRSNAG